MATAPARGDLRIEYRPDERRNRVVRVARLFDPMDGTEDVLLPLEAVELIGMSQLAFTLTGIENVDGVRFAQTWLVRPAPDARRPDSDKMHPATRRRLGV